MQLPLVASSMPWLSRPCLAAAEAFPGDQPTEKAKKKAKKEKKSKNGGAAAPAASAEEVAAALQALASVGDASLAKNGKKIIKALYKEHPEVKAMTAEQVRNAGDEHKMKIPRTGLLLRVRSCTSPLPAHKQAGTCIPLFLQS